jgi:ferredoxin
VGINVPIAIQAGLGEDGRHGMLVTPEFGSNIRTAKVFTNMPMLKDKPISFGLQEFCNSCAKCASSCPVQSLDFGPRKWDAVDESNNPGVYKFYHPYKKCLYFWMENGFTCGNCIAMCEGDVWVYANRARDPQWLAANRAAVDRYWNARASAFGHGLRVDPNRLWSMPLEPYGLDHNLELAKAREALKDRKRH